jgi:sugar phosphate isomerase/epimerase
MHRREFLSLSLALAATAKSSEPSITFPTETRHRLSVSTYPFRSFIVSPVKPVGELRLTLAQFADSIVERFNVYGIEPWSAHFEAVEPEYLRGLKNSFDSAGLRVVNIPCDVRVRPCGTAAEQTATQETWHKWVEAALIIGSPSIRVHVPPGKSSEDISCAVDALGALASHGASKNIVINLENDDPRGEEPYRVLKVIERVNSPYLRSLPDFCNSMQIHDDREYNTRALAALFPHAFNISHVKDVEIVNGKTLSVDVNRIFTIAKAAGYRGYFSMETEGSTDPYQGTRQLIDAAVRNLSPQA